MQSVPHYRPPCRIHNFNHDLCRSQYAKRPSNESRFDNLLVIRPAIYYYYPGGTATTDDQTAATAKIATPEHRIGFFVKRHLTVDQQTESSTTATKAYRKRFYLTLNQIPHSLSLNYLQPIIAFPCSTVQ
jgi:hypothetical protein